MAKQEKLTSFSTLFPEIIYDKDQISEKSLDIWNSYRLSVFPKKFNYQAFDKFPIKSSDTVESIASRYYGDPKMWWLVLLSNDAEDPFTFINDSIKNSNENKGVINLLKIKYLGEIMLAMKKYKNVQKRDINRN